MAFWGTAFLLIVSILLMMYCVMTLGKWRGKVASGIGGAVFGMEMALLPWCILWFIIEAKGNSASPLYGISLDNPIRNIMFIAEGHAEFAKGIVLNFQNGKSEDFWFGVFFLSMLLICAGISFAFMYSLSKKYGDFKMLWAIVGVSALADIVFFILFGIAALIYTIANNANSVAGMIVLWVCVASLLGGGGKVVVLLFEKK